MPPPQRRAGYRNYTSSGKYWTVRKYGSVYWVVLIDPSSGTYLWDEVWGGYLRAGDAGGAAAHLAYAQGQQETLERVRGSLHEALGGIGLGVPVPMPAPVAPSAAPEPVSGDEDE